MITSIGVDEYELTEEQEAEIEASIAEIERGEYVDGDEIIRELRRRLSVREKAPREEYVPTPEGPRIERGDYVTLDEVMRDVRAMRDAEERKRR